jgi:FtsH ternary system domain X6
VTDLAAPRMVSRFEASLLRLLRFFLKQVPAEEGLRLVNAKAHRPDCLSAAAVHLVRDSLSKGCVLYLVKAGGWRRERYLRRGAPKFGRLWERSEIPDLTLQFSRQSMEFLIWITASKPGDGKPTWQPALKALTPADQLLLFLAYEAVHSEPDSAAAMRATPAFATNPLIWLAYADEFASAAPDAVPDFAPWLTGLGSFILEAMQPVFLERWLSIERGKGQIGDWQRMLQQGRAEQQLLDKFVAGIESAGRLDLSRFLLGTLAAVLATPDLPPTFWTGGLQGSGPPRLAERLETQRSAMSLLRQTERFRRWEQRARRSGWDDEDRDAQKFWLSEWERFDGDTVARRAEQILHQLEPLRT